MTSKPRQDYIARIRYQNDLPPPPCPPKLLDIPIDIQKLTSWAFLSDLVRKQPPNMDLDMDQGMPLDMATVPGIFDREDEGECYPLDPLPQLDSKDAILLRDPSGDASSLRTQPNVSFLRRTEYISSEIVRQKSENRPSSQSKDEKAINPEAQLRAVEETFEAANVDLATLKHPKNKKLKAVESFAILPDFKQLDLTYLTVKMVNSASLSTLPEKHSDSAYSVSLFRPTSLETDEWMSFFVPSDQDSKKLKRKLDDPRDSNIIDEDDENENLYRFNHVRDYEMELVQNEKNFNDIAINFDDTSIEHTGEEGEERRPTAWFVPIAGKTNLKRRRVTEDQRQQVAEHNFSSIEFSLRELTAEESLARDNVRAEYDSVSYMTTNEAGQVLNDEDDD